MSLSPSTFRRGGVWFGTKWRLVLLFSVGLLSVFTSRFDENEPPELKGHNILPKVIPPTSRIHRGINERDDIDEEEADESIDFNHERMDILRDEFENWIELHSKKYEDEQEKEKKFSVWIQNHKKTIEKNLVHGPCKMTKKPVFGSNHFKDLTPEEFQSKYLTGYTGPRVDEPVGKRRLRQKEGILMGKQQVKDPRKVGRHQSVQDRYLKEIEDVPLIPKEYFEKHGFRESHNNGDERKSYNSCAWYEVACMLRKVFTPIFGSTAESMYNNYAYPEAIDFRSLGAVTDVHSQGNCGACWAITAIETVESAYFLSKGTLYDLAESEVITCDDSCAMCSGGWPQNAYSYVISNNGLPLENSLSYDGDFLTTFSSVSEGESDEFSQSYLESYKSATCPSEGSSKYARYAPIKSYGYATDRCVCYTDGSGCDCEEQNEAEAIMNVASYGPASVCLEASTWQDYNGGIITSDSGCTSDFFDMNHCVQIVGYAFTTGTDNDYYDGESKSGSQSGSGDDDTQREGYWIVRNQWSTYWGMNGYAYVAMGGNTCGVLNDMTQAFVN